MNWRKKLKQAEDEIKINYVSEISSAKAKRIDIKKVYKSMQKMLKKYLAGK